MSKVTSKLQVTLPKRIAEQYDIRPGQEIEFTPAGDAIRVELPGSQSAELSPAERLRLFDQATDRIRTRRRGAQRARGAERGWDRDDLYERGRAR